VPGRHGILSLTGPATSPTARIVRLLIGAGADPNGLTSGRDSPGQGDETPLHYAASSDDVDAAEALIEGERISRYLMARSALRSITPWATAAGMSPACWWRVAPGLTRPRMRPRWACSAASQRCWEAIRQRRMCRKRSGIPAPAASAGRRSICCRAARISAGSRITRMARRLTPPAGWVPARRTSSPGCARWERLPPAPIDSKGLLQPVRAIVLSVAGPLPGNPGLPRGELGGVASTSARGMWAVGDGSWVSALIRRRNGERDVTALARKDGQARMPEAYLPETSSQRRYPLAN
jgi:hypothetical protein